MPVHQNSRQVPHPDVETKIGLAYHAGPPGGALPKIVDENVKTVEVDLPMGLVGDATDVPVCSSVLFENNTCPADSQVGVQQTDFGGGVIEKDPVYNLLPPPGTPAQLGVDVLRIVPVVISVNVRPDGGLRATVSNINEGLQIIGIDLTLWGEPANAVHDSDRSIPGTYNFGLESQAPPVAFLASPTRCDEPLVSVLRTTSWQRPDDLSVASSETSGPLTGCDSLSFKPSLSVAADTATAGAPAGYTFDIDVPQPTEPGSLQTPEVRDAVLTMPAGTALNPAAAEGLGSCTDAQFAADSSVPAGCPSSSRVGAVRIDTPLLKAPLEGNVFIGTPLSSDPASGQMYRMFVQAQGEGATVKLHGAVSVNPETGRIVASFFDSPQLPFEHLTLSLTGGPRALLRNPTTCGNAESVAAFTPWNSAVASTQRSSFSIDEGCSSRSQFAPGLIAGTANPVAGASSPFVFKVIRPDGQQNISGIEATLPDGLLARLRGVALCGAAEATSGSCDPASAIGVATVGVGAGSQPLSLPQPSKAPTAVYLAGPYKGAPYSLVVKVPAQAGPFDLGTVVVRAALQVDPTTTQIRVVADQLPQIIGGVPVEYQSISLNVNRPEFVQNPTNCEAMMVASRITSVQGATAAPSSRFQVGECAALGLAPKLALKFSGAPTRRGGHPKLTATLTTRSGDSNLRQIQVTLPKTEYLENAHIRTVCTRVQYAANQCPQKSIYGYAQGVDAAARQAARRAGVPALEQQQAARPGGLARRADPHRPRRTDQLVQVADPQHVRNGPGRAGEQIRADDAGGRQGPPRQQHEPLQGEADGERRVRRPERQGREHRTAGDGRRL